MFGSYPTFQSNFPISFQTYHFVQLTRKKLQFFQNPQFFEIFLYKGSKKKKKKTRIDNKHLVSQQKQSIHIKHIPIFLFYFKHIASSISAPSHKTFSISISLSSRETVVQNPIA